MSDHSGFKYLFDQTNLNSRQSRWLAMITKFNLEIKYIKGKEKMITHILRRKIHVNHIETMSSYGTNLHAKILQVGQ